MDKLEKSGFLAGDATNTRIKITEKKLPMSIIHNSRYVLQD